MEPTLTPSTGTISANSLPEPLMGGIGLLVIILIVWACVARSKAKKKRKAQGGSTMRAALKHIYGLPIAENVVCTVKSFAQKIEFSAGNMSVNLEKSKIIDMSITTDVDIQKQYVSSAGGAIGGAILFGPVGALIGGRAKKKKITQSTSYFIITYNSDGETKYIGFELQDSFALSAASRFVREFKKQERETVQVNL